MVCSYWSLGRGLDWRLRPSDLLNARVFKRSWEICTDWRDFGGHYRDDFSKSFSISILSFRIFWVQWKQHITSASCRHFVAGTVYTSLVPHCVSAAPYAGVI